MSASHRAMHSAFALPVNELQQPKHAPLPQHSEHWLAWDGLAQLLVHAPHVPADSTSVDSPGADFSGPSERQGVPPPISLGSCNANARLQSPDPKKQPTIPKANKPRNEVLTILISPGSQSGECTTPPVEAKHYLKGRIVHPPHRLCQGVPVGCFRFFPTNHPPCVAAKLAETPDPQS